jgi:threonine/homoserine/homoserine lactone efflux protein
VRSVPEFLLVALVVTLTPGPATALILRVTARDGRRAAVGAVAGNSLGILGWAGLSALGVSSLILASEVAHDVLRIGGAVILIVLGLRSLLHRAEATVRLRRGKYGWRAGFAASLANPKLAVFFIALFPQFLDPHTRVLPAALLMACVIVCFDLLWFGTLIYAVHGAAALLKPRVRVTMERITGAAMVALGVSVAADVS